MTSRPVSPGEFPVCATESGWRFLMQPFEVTAGGYVYLDAVVGLDELWNADFHPVLDYGRFGAESLLPRSACFLTQGDFALLSNITEAGVRQRITTG